MLSVLARDEHRAAGMGNVLHIAVIAGAIVVVISQVFGSQRLSEQLDDP